MKTLSYLAGIVLLQVFCAVPQQATSSQHLLFSPGQLSLTLADE